MEFAPTTLPLSTIPRFNEIVPFLFSLVFCLFLLLLLSFFLFFLLQYRARTDQSAVQNARDMTPYGSKSIMAPMP